MWCVLSYLKTTNKQLFCCCCCCCCYDTHVEPPVNGLLKTKELMWGFLEPEDTWVTHLVLVQISCCCCGLWLTQVDALRLADWSWHPANLPLSPPGNLLKAAGSLRTHLRQGPTGESRTRSRTMRPSSVLFIFLLLCCFQMMLVSMPTCRLPGKVVQNTHNLLRDLVGHCGLCLWFWTGSSVALCS